jgi:hypothetical protein
MKRTQSEIKLLNCRLNLNFKVRIRFSGLIDKIHNLIGIIVTQRLR